MPARSAFGFAGNRIAPGSTATVTLPVSILLYEAGEGLRFDDLAGQLEPDPLFDEDEII